MSRLVTVADANPGWRNPLIWDDVAAAVAGIASREPFNGTSRAGPEPIPLDGLV